MNRLIYAASEQCSDLLYETGFSAPDSFLWFEAGGESCMVVSPLEAGRATRQALPGVSVIGFDEARRRFGLPDGPFGTAALIAAISRTLGVRSWRVPSDFPYGLGRQLLDRGLCLRPVSPFSPGRERKSPREVSAIREAIAMTEAGLERACEVLRGAAVAPDGTLLWNGEKLTAETLRSEIDIAIARRGGCAAGTIAAPGRQGADPHCVGFGPIRAGEPIVLDVFPRSRDTGYYGDLTRTLARGAVPEEVRRAFATVQEAQQLAFGAIRAGVPGRDPHLAVARLFEERGYETSTAMPAHGFFHGLGHSIGLDIHESPSLSPRNARPLEAGNVVTVEPGLYYPEWGGIRIEDDVLVTEDGCERLSSFPVFLEL